MLTAGWILLAVAGLHFIWELFTDREPPRLQRPGLWFLLGLLALYVKLEWGMDRPGGWQVLIFVSMACSGMAIVLLGRQVIRKRRARRAGGVSPSP